MGSFIGHIDEAILLILLAVWWMYKGFTCHIRSTLGIGKFSFQMSYFSRIRGRKIPLEQILKILFPLIAFFGELATSELYFRDEDGNFAGQHYIMHMSIYGFFIVHGLVDTLQKYGVRGMLPQGDFITAGLAFFWYGLGVYYHSTAKTKKPRKLEKILHQIPLFLMFVVSLMCFLATKLSKCFVIDVLRCYCLAMIGTWFFTMSFIMYKPTIPGTAWNWDQESIYNIKMVPPIFGFHMVLNTVFMILFYGFCYWLVTRSMTPVAKYKAAKNKDEEAVSLMDGSD